jgi:hypothetical protein
MSKRKIYKNLIKQINKSNAWFIPIEPMVIQLQCPLMSISLWDPIMPACIKRLQRAIGARSGSAKNRLREGGSTLLGVEPAMPGVHDQIAEPSMCRIVLQQRAPVQRLVVNRHLKRYLRNLQPEFGRIAI